MVPAVSVMLKVLQACKKNPVLRRAVLTSSSSIGRIREDIDLTTSSSSTVRIREDIDLTITLDETSGRSVEICERLEMKP